MEDILEFPVFSGWEEEEEDISVEINKTGLEYFWKNFEDKNFENDAKCCFAR